MEGYNEVENDAGDAYPYDITIAGTEYDKPDHNMQKVCHKEEEEDVYRGKLIKMGVFKPISGNATKWLRMCQGTYGTTKTTSIKAAISAEAIINQFAGEKERMEGWKTIVMQKIAQELHGIWRTQEEALEA